MYLVFRRLLFILSGLLALGHRSPVILACSIMCTSLSIFHANCQGYNTAKPDLDLLLHEYKPDIISLQETLHDNTNPVTLRGYTDYHIPSSNDTRGSSLFIRQDISSTRNTVNLPNNRSECISVNLHLSKTNTLRIICAYSPQEQLSVDYIRNELKDNQNTILIGDLNARHPSFGDTHTNVNGHKLNDLYMDNILYSANPGIPTRYSQRIRNPEPPSVIDFIIGNLKTFPNIRDFSVLDPIHSDHRPIFARYETTKFPRTTPSPKPCFEKADWTSYRKYINDHLHQLPIISNNKDSIDNSIEQFTKLIQDSDSLFVPRSTPKDKIPLPPCIVNLIKERKRLLRSFYNKPTQDKKARINELRRRIHSDIKTYREDSMRNKFNGIANKNPAAFWPTVRKIMKSGQSVPSVPLSANGTKYITPAEKAKCFHELYQDIHSVPPPDPVMMISIETYRTLTTG